MKLPVGRVAKKLWIPIVLVVVFAVAGLLVLSLLLLLPPLLPQPATIKATTVRQSRATGRRGWVISDS